MRKSRTITLTVLAGLTLTGCSLASLGCGKRDAHTPESSAQQYEPPDHTWFDEDGNPVPEKWKTDDQGNRVPAHGVPHDRYGRPWVHSGGIWAPLLIPVGYSAPYRAPARSSSWLTGGSGYRTSNTTTTYRAGAGTGSSSVASPHSSSAPAGSSISRGGLGSTGSSSGSSSSS